MLFWGFTQRIVAILPLPEERSSKLLHSGTLKSCKFLQARRHKYHTPTFLVCTTQWCLTNKIFYSPNLPHGIHSVFRNQNFRPHALLSSFRFCYWYQNYCYMLFQLQPQLKIFIMPNIYSPTISQMDQTITPPPKKKLSHYII